MDLSLLLPIAEKPGYAACLETGQIFNINTGQELKQFLKKSAYRYYVHVWFGRVHRCIMGASLGRPLERTELVLHRDGNATANSIANLSIGTAKQNAADRLRHGTYGRKLSSADVREIKLLRHMKATALAAEYGVSVSHIRAIRAGRSWAGLV